MKYVFIDTSIFVADNFLEGRKITELFKLSEDGEITIILTKITYHEIISRFRKNIRENVGSIKPFREKGKAFKNLPSKKSLFDSFDEDENVKEFTELFDKKLKQSKCLIIDYPVINISEVFDKYFAKEPPFGAGQKKNEFPDAFTLLTLEKWCEKINTQCHILSMDKDMLTYTAERLLVAPNYEEFLDKTLKSVKENKAIIGSALQYLTSYKSEVESAVKDWLFESLDDELKYAEAVNYMEVHDITIKEHSVTFFDDPRVVSVYDDIVEIELEGEVYYTVDVEIDDEEQSYYDDEDKVVHYYDTTMARIERVDEIRVLVKIETSLEDNQAESHGLEVAEINEGQKLEIQPDRRRYY